MITGFICDKCGEEAKGSPYGYREEGDLCGECWYGDQLTDLQQKIGELQATIIRSSEKIDEYTWEMEKLMGEQDGS